jgi:hypothetical protein
LVSNRLGFLQAWQFISLYLHFFFFNFSCPCPVPCPNLPTPCPSSTPPQYIAHSVCIYIYTTYKCHKDIIKNRRLSGRFLKFLVWK